MVKHNFLLVLVLFLLTSFSIQVFAQDKDVKIETQTVVKKPISYFILTDDQSWDAMVMQEMN